MRIVIGITQQQENIEQVLNQHSGRQESLTQVGPFISHDEACTWMQCLKDKLGELEVTDPTPKLENDTFWYGFTFEKE